MDSPYQDPQYSLRLKKIEAQLNRILPESPGASWIAGIFPGLGGGNGAGPMPGAASRDAAVPADLAGPLTRPGRDILDRGGKRWRPLLMTLVCEALGGGDAALPLVPLVELPHNASLIHDDIEDNSDERRGKPAVHLIYGTDAAINGGSFLYFLPLACIGPWEAPAELKNRVYEAWGEHLRRLHLGQAMDISWHRDFGSRPSPEDYALMCRLKTGSLARLAAVLGVYAGEIRTAAGTEAGADTAFDARVSALAESLGGAAEKLGLGFQILDDVKNLRTGNPGKKRGDDIVEGKKSLPVLLLLRDRPEAGVLVERCFVAARAGGAAVPEVEELIGVLEAAGALETAQTRGLALIAEARAALGGIPRRAGSGEARELLAALTDAIS